jgi:DNA-binding transcriptional MerR regulator
VSPTAPAQATTRKLRRRDLATRYGVDIRTIQRWDKRGGILPPAEIINGYPYYDLDELEECERRRMRAAGAVS